MRKRKTIKREDHWRSILERWRTSGMTLAEFARRETLSYWTLWDWKKRLGIGRRNSNRSESKGSARKGTSDPEFVPVRVVDGMTYSQEPQDRASGSPVEVLLRCGQAVRFDSRCDLGFLAAVVSTLEAC